MQTQKATAIAFPNIALIKYWGNRDQALRLPSNESISFNLGDLRTTTSVEFDPRLTRDEVSIDGHAVANHAYERVVHHLDRVADSAPAALKHSMPALLDGRLRARVVSNNTFPMGVGIASSASGFAALTLAACAALGMVKTEAELSGLARLGSGSACRSVPGGFVLWRDAYAVSIAPPRQWNLVDIIAIVAGKHKTVGSTEGHALADTSPLQIARVNDTARRLNLCEQAIAHCDFELLASVIEQDALMMHAVIMTSQPSIIYWVPATFSIIEAVRELRRSGVPVAFTIDAGPNVHCICEAHALKQVKQALWQMDGVRDVIQSDVGGPAYVV
ncbi:MAG: diphosphomevalonate decarboxylase [Chloroflexi bacterium]|nr:diphosphomevalonate decarboxylase [Chloroflexota bacterium]